jgi:hypothetical protein
VIFPRCQSIRELVRELAHMRVSSACVPGRGLERATGRHKKAPAFAGAFFRMQGYFDLAIFISKSTVRQEYPHSLSYQETILKNLFSPFRLFCMVARLS